MIQILINSNGNFPEESDYDPELVFEGQVHSGEEYELRHWMLGQKVYKLSVAQYEAIVYLDDGNGNVVELIPDEDGEVFYQI